MVEIYKPYEIKVTPSFSLWAVLNTTTDRLTRNERGSLVVFMEWRQANDKALELNLEGEES